MCVCVCVHKVFLVYICFLPGQLNSALSFPGSLHEDVLLTFYTTMLLFLGKKCTGRRKENIDKEGLAGSYYHCQIVFSEVFMKYKFRKYFTIFFKWVSAHTFQRWKSFAHLLQL